jgi:ubiquinone/menaquinone biosynthesis C-methylase UbiE
MKKASVSYFQEQENVTAYFQSQSLHWRKIYESSGVEAEIIQDRHAAVLHWVDSLKLAQGSSVLEVGCGAGLMAVALAQRGFHVQAFDSSEAMIEQARLYAEESLTNDLLTLKVRDVYSLDFSDDSFDLVLAIGVIPWLERLEPAIQEMVRVVKPGGYIVLTTANRMGLMSVLDPWRNPAFEPLKRRLKELLSSIAHRNFSPSMYFHANRFIDKTLSRQKCIKTRSMTRGFGFSLRNRSILPEPFGTKLHHLLQYLADRNIPVFRSIGMAYFILARKQVSHSFARSMNVDGS